MPVYHMLHKNGQIALWPYTNGSMCTMPEFGRAASEGAAALQPGNTLILDVRSPNKRARGKRRGCSLARLMHTCDMTHWYGWISARASSLAASRAPQESGQNFRGFQPAFPAICLRLFGDRTSHTINLRWDIEVHVQVRYQTCNIKCDIRHLTSSAISDIRSPNEEMSDLRKHGKRWENGEKRAGYNPW